MGSKKLGSIRFRRHSVVCRLQHKVCMLCRKHEGTVIQDAVFADDDDDDDDYY